jgi:outer membrane immunogenic protein
MRLFGTIEGQQMRIAIIAATAALAGMGAAGGVHAADLGGSLKDTGAHSYAPNWAGIYVGGSAGFGTGDTSDKIDITDLKDHPKLEGFLERLLQSKYDVNGAIYGLHAGYNVQRDNLVFGVEAGFNGTNLDGASPCVVIGFCQRELNWYGTGVARLGYAAGNNLFYGFGGVAWGDVKTKVGIASPGFTVINGDESHLGWTAGLGLEHAFNDRFSVRIEYSHVDLGSENTALTYRDRTIKHVSDEVDLSFDAIKIGASYKLTGERGVEPLK